MSDQPKSVQSPDDIAVRTEAKTVRSRWPGLVWAVPLAALLIVAYLGLNAYARQGIDVVVTFGTSAGAKAGETPVIYKGATVGKVVKIEVNRDARRIDMTLRMEPHTRNALREGAQFWLIGAQPNLLDPAALKAVVSGVSIGASPGTGRPTRHFIGTDEAPPVPPDTPGRFFRLHSASIGRAPVGSGVYFHGVLVGHVTAARIAGSHAFEFGVFITAPNDRLVQSDTVFFAARAVDLDLTRQGLSAQLGPGDSALRGGVEFDNPSTTDEPEAPSGALFPLYGTEGQGVDQPVGPQIAYQAVFRGAAAQPATDAPVLMGGERVGRVLSSQQGVRIGDPAPVTRVQLEIESNKLNLSGTAARSIDDETAARAATDAALAGLVRGGYRLKLGQAPPLIGGEAVLLAQAPGPGKGAVIRKDEGPPELPTAASADLDVITDRAGAILDKVNRIPLTEIGSDVHAITGRVRQLVTSPEISDGLMHLDSTLRQVDQMVTEVKPQVGPLITKLNTAAGELQGVARSANAVLSSQGGQDANLPDAIRQLTEAARSIRSLADYLGRHPEAVIRGKAKEP